MNKRFMVTNHEFVNTGGNSMVSVFTVYDKQQKATRYVMTAEEGGSLQAVDTVNGDFQFESYDEECEAVIDNWSFDDLTTQPFPCSKEFTDEEFELYKYCQFEFYKENCKYFGTKVYITVDQLPQALYNELGEAAAAWHYHNAQLVATDGYHVWPSSYYNAESYEQSYRELQQVTDFQQWHCEQAAKEELYDEYYVLSFAGRSVKLPYDADAFDAVDNLLTRIIEEW